MKDPLGLRDLLGHLVRGDRLVLLDLSDLLEGRALRDLLETLERKVFLVRKVLLVQPVGMEFRVPWVCLAQLDHLEYLERTETRVRLENRVRKEPKEERENMVLLVHLVLWVLLGSPVLLALMEKLVPGVSRDISGLKVMRGLEVSQEPQDPLASRDCLVHRVRRERPEMSALWDPLGPRDPVALPDPVVLTVPKVLLVVWEIPDLLEKRESPGRAAHLELWGSQERRVQEVSVERREKQANQEQVGPPAEEVDRETMGLKETLVLLVFLVILVLLEKLDLEVKMGPRESEERTVNKENLALLDPLVKTDLPDPLEREDLLEHEDQRVARERRAPRETQVLLDPQEKLALLDPKALPENQEWRVSEDSQDQWGSRGLQGRPDRQDHLDLLALRVCLV